MTARTAARHAISADLHGRVWRDDIDIIRADLAALRALADTVDSALLADLGPSASNWSSAATAILGMVE